MFRANFDMFRAKTIFLEDAGHHDCADVDLVPAHSHADNEDNNDNEEDGEDDSDEHSGGNSITGVALLSSTVGWTVG
jgi:hypothetical protein